MFYCCSLSPPASFKKINSLKAICKHHNTSLQITFNDTVELATVNYVWLQSEILQWSWNLREVSLTKGAFDSLIVKKKMAEIICSNKAVTGRQHCLMMCRLEAPMVQKAQKRGTVFSTSYLFLDHFSGTNKQRGVLDVPLPKCDLQQRKHRHWQ